MVQIFKGGENQPIYMRSDGTPIKPIAKKKETKERNVGVLQLYARKEPTRDTVSIEHGLENKMDTVIYGDAECTDLRARWPWHLSDCPRRSIDNSIMFNCWKWDLKWLPDLELTPESSNLPAP